MAPAIVPPNPAPMAQRNKWRALIPFPRSKRAAPKRSVAKLIPRIAPETPRACFSIPSPFRKKERKEE